MSRRARTITQVWPAHSTEADLAATPRDDVVAEQHDTDGGFSQAEGPFAEYRRVVSRQDDTVQQTVTYRLHIPWFGWLFEGPMRAALRRRRPPGSRPPWWSPPDRLTPRQVLVLGLLASASLSATFINTLFTQTANFAADDFGISSGGQGFGGVVVRLGVVIAIPFAMLADRRGRRTMIIIVAWLAPLFAALGALAPNFWTLVATQSIGRPLSLALALLIGVVVTEEMPRNSRTYALSVLALAGGLGAGVAVAALPLADLGAGGWRFVYVIALLWLVVAADLTRSLPETHRFETHQLETHQFETGGPGTSHRAAPRLRRRRFATIATVAVAANLFVAPASFFQNRYLDDVRGFSASSIMVFTFMTATPASIGLVAGGRIADIVGRRRVLITCMPVATAMLVMSFSVGGPLMWLGALLGGLASGLAYPAFAIYRTEMFPTGNRSTVNGWITAISLAGSSIGLVIAGQLIDSGWTYGSVMLTLGAGQIVAAVLAYVAYPETAHLTLEEINPEDPALSTEGT